MKFINYLESITGIGVYPMISFMIFFVFFLLVSAYLIKSGSRHFDRASNIPLDNDDQP
jgi:cytochrome c oxidase cbb3-type subunit 3